MKKTITYDDTLYCLVPIEPTTQMYEAAIVAFHAPENRHGAILDEVYKAMLAASPTNIPPAQEPDEIRAAGQCCCDDS